MIANRAWQRWQLLALLEEIQLKSSQEEQQPRNRCCSLPLVQLGYTQPSSNKPQWRIWHTNLESEEHVHYVYIELPENCNNRKHQENEATQDKCISCSKNRQLLIIGHLTLGIVFTIRICFQHKKWMTNINGAQKHSEKKYHTGVDVTHTHTNDKIHTGHVPPI